MKCSICHESLPLDLSSGHQFFVMTDEQEEVISHLFHKQCLEASVEWVNRRCPLCRKVFLMKKEESQLVLAVERGNIDKVKKLLEEKIFTPPALQNALRAAVTLKFEECIHALKQSRLYSQADLKRIMR